MVLVCSDRFVDQVNFLFDVNALQTVGLDGAGVRIGSVRFRSSGSVDVCFVRRSRQGVQCILGILDSVAAAGAALQKSIARGRLVVLSRRLRVAIMLKEETTERG